MSAKPSRSLNGNSTCSKMNVRNVRLKKKRLTVSYKFRGYKGSIKCYKCDATSENGMALMWFLCEASENAKYYRCCPEHAEELVNTFGVDLIERYEDVPVIYEHTWALWQKDWHKLPEGGEDRTKEDWYRHMDMLIEENSRS